jgi:hypothetical protein
MRALRAISTFAIALVLFSVGHAALAADSCPVHLVRGTADVNHLSITFINTSTQPIRALSFHCKLVDARKDNAEIAHCYDTNAHFLPHTEYTTAYSVDVRGPVLVWVKEAVFANGRKWKPTGSTCNILKVVPADDHGRPSSR